MEFDESRVYTGLNADKINVGSMVFVANNMANLFHKVQTESSRCGSQIVQILDKRYSNRFVVRGVVREEAYNLAYLIKEPDGPQYRPYEDGEEAFMYLHDKWLKYKTLNVFCKITGFYEYNVRLNNEVPDFETLLEEWEIYSETGRNEPCGIKIE